MAQKERIGRIGTGFLRTGVLVGILALVALAMVTMRGGGPGAPSASAHVVATPSCTTTGPYTVCSDAQNYFPNAIAHISGSGFASSATLTIKVTRPDGSVITGDGSGTPGSDDLTTDGVGSFQYDYQLNGIFGTYTVDVLAGPAPGGAFLATHTFTDAGVNLDQCANGSTPTTACNWQNGNINQSNSVYAEGESIPYRLFITKLDPSITHTIRINHDFTQGGEKAYDFLTTWNVTQTTADVCAGPAAAPAPCPPGSATTLAFLGDTFNPSNKGALTVNGAITDAGVSRNLTIWNGNIKSISSVTHTGPVTGNSNADMLVTFNADPCVGAGCTSTVLLAWAGHISKSSFWGPANGASGISGSPFHMRTLNLDNGGGANQDRSVQLSAIVQPPPTLEVVKVVIGTPTDGGQFILRIDTTFFVTGDVKDGGTTGPVVVSVGTHTVDEIAGTGTSLANYTSVIGGDCDTSGNVTLADGESKICTITNTVSGAPSATLKVIKVVNNAFGGTALKTDFDLFIDGNPVTNSAVNTVSVGKHVVSEANPGPGYTQVSITCDTDPTTGSFITAGTVTVANGETWICTITNAAVQPQLKVDKVLVPAADPGRFDLKIDGSTAGTGGNVGNGGSTGFVGVTVGAHTVGESGFGGTNLADYDSVISGPSTCASGSVTLALGEQLTCTITNRRLPTLQVNKVLDPATDPGRFNLQIDGSTEGTGGNVGNGGTTGQVQVPIGSRTVGETAVIGTSLLQYTTVIGGDCDAGGLVTLAAGDKKKCTITNTRSPVKVGGDLRRIDPAELPLETVDSPGSGTGILVAVVSGVAAAVVALSGTAWYARRRWLRWRRPDARGVNDQT